MHGWGLFSLFVILESRKLKLTSSPLLDLNKCNASWSIGRGRLARETLTNNMARTISDNNMLVWFGTLKRTKFQNVMVLYLTEINSFLR
jgi:hypothetical protein